MPAPENAKPPKALFDEEIYADLVETLFDTTGTLIAGILAGLLAPAIAWLSTGETVYVALTGVMAAIALFRMALLFSHNRASIASRRNNARTWELLYTIGAIGFMAGIGLSAALLFTRHHSEMISYYGVVIMTGVTGVLASRNAGRPRIVMWQVAATCGPLAISILVNFSVWYWGLSLFLIFGAISVISTTKFLHGHLESALRNGLDANFHRKRFGLALNSMSHGLCMGDASLQVSVVNNRVTEFFGSVAPSTPERLEVIAEGIGQNAGLSAREIEQFVDQWRKHAAMPHASVFSQDIGERVFDFRCEPAEAGGFVTVIEDVTTQRSVVREIERLAHFDCLTDLPNRHQFQKQLEEGMNAASVGENQLTLLKIDLDRFKEVNDTLGHAAGDDLLRAVAARLRHETRRTDTVARFGGDEFCILIPPNATPINAEEVAERIIRALRKPYMIEQHVIVIDASIGIASAPRDTTTAEGLMRFSDLALYRAKSAGRGRVRTFQTSMLDALEKRRQTEDDLRFAIERDELVLYYQPIIDVRKRRLTCCESLMRWRHPTRGLVPPLEFIPIAEDTGLIVTLGEWAIRRACRDALAWPDEMRVAVNLSPRQFQQKNLVQMIQNAVSDSGLAPERLEIEITELTLMQDTQDVARKLDELVGLGVRLSLDDFGTGYSSLGYLNRFPVDKVKLDRSFTLRLADSPKTQAIVGAISTLARELDIELVAEGVETNEQLAQLAMKNVYLILRLPVQPSLASGRIRAPDVAVGYAARTRACGVSLTGRAILPISRTVLTADDDRRRTPHRGLQQSFELGREPEIDRRVRSLRFGAHHGAAGVGRLADRYIERNFAQEGRAHCLRVAPRAAVRENVAALTATRTQEIAHVLDDAENGRLDLLEHGDGPPRVEQGQILRRGDDHRPGQRHLLRQGELHVAGARRHVDDERVQFAPLRLAEHLHQRLRHHGAAPDHRHFLVDEKADRHDLYAIGLERNHLAVLDLRFARQAEEARRRRAVDVGVEQAHAPALRRKPQRKIGGGRRFADAALSRRDGDDETYVFHCRDHSPARRRRMGVVVSMGVVVPMTGRRLGFRGGALGGKRDIGLFDAGDALDGAFRGEADLFPCPGLPAIADDRDKSLGAGHRNPAHCPRRRERRAARSRNALERLQDIRFIRHGRNPP